MKKSLLIAYTLILCIMLSGCMLSTAEVEQKSLAAHEVTEEQVEREADITEADVEESGESDPIGEEPGFISPYTFEYPDAVRGIYVTGHSAGGAKFEKLLDLVNRTELNAMVIDIKDDYGNLTFRPEVESPFYDISQPYIKDIHDLLETLEAHQIYPIARIVVFKDSVIANQKPEWSFLDNGQVWKNRRGEAFINPFLKEVWEYNVEIAKLAAELGFQEIQFDYVRFPEGFEKRDEILTYSLGEYEDKAPTKILELEKLYLQELTQYEKDLSQLKERLAAVDDEEARASILAEIDSLEASKPVKPELSAKETQVQLRVDAVTDFVAYAKKELQEYNVDVSVDIFGYTATLPEAPGIGQNFTKISRHVDVISSMIYPSHWTAYFGIPKPDLEPYRLVTEYVKMEQEKLAQLENPPVSRPWIQDFTATWLGRGNYQKYGVAEVEAQIRALNEAGIWEFLLWNAGNNYTEGVNYKPLGQE